MLYETWPCSVETRQRAVWADFYNAIPSVCQQILHASPPQLVLLLQAKKLILPPLKTCRPGRIALPHAGCYATDYCDLNPVRKKLNKTVKISWNSVVGVGWGMAFSDHKFYILWPLFIKFHTGTKLNMKYNIGHIIAMLFWISNIHKMRLFYLQITTFTPLDRFPSNFVQGWNFIKWVT